MKRPSKPTLKARAKAMAKNQNRTIFVVTDTCELTGRHETYFCTDFELDTHYKGRNILFAAHPCGEIEQ